MNIVLHMSLSLLYQSFRSLLVFRILATTLLTMLEVHCLSWSSRMRSNWLPTVCSWVVLFTTTISWPTDSSATKGGQTYRAEARALLTVEPEVLNKRLSNQEIESAVGKVAYGPRIQCDISAGNAMRLQMEERYHFLALHHMRNELPLLDARGEASGILCASVQDHHR